MMQEDVAQSFIDVPFDWTLSYFSARTTEGADGKYILVILRPYSVDDSPLVFCSFPVERRGELMTLSKGDKVRIKGRIKSAGSSAIQVDVTEFTRP